MSDSEDDDYSYFGTPLEQFDEDLVPRKKPISVEDQIATDSHGRRRFHGAFTGGFSAGFFNSVGSLEGWKPSTFKSSRNDRSSFQQHLPSHFMDDEDVEEFGIAPQSLKTKPEYSSTKRNSKKRDHEILNSGPIPGEPVLKSILKPAKHTIGIVLLKKMGWRPGDDIGEKVKRKRVKKSFDNTSVIIKPKIYGCARGPDEAFQSAAEDKESSSSSDDDDNEIYKELGEKAPSFIKKEDVMGLGYKGLDRFTLSGGPVKTSKQITIRDQFNKTIKISGQAFGVGAFEEEDDDIYSVDDKSQYDFSLGPVKSSKNCSKHLAAITDGNNIILGFVKASFKETNKIYPGPKVPSSFSGKHIEKKSRFDAGPGGDLLEPSRQKLDANLRSAILDDPATPIKTKATIPDIDEKKNNSETNVSQTLDQDHSWKPFNSDLFKQERYEKYLQLIKIGAKDLVHTVLLNTMTDIERESELREFEGAARLYSGKLMSDRFTHGDSLSESDVHKGDIQKDNENVRKRVTLDWAPHPIVCKRFNIRPPDNAGVSLQSVAESTKKPKFSVFDFLNSSKSTNLAELVESNINRNENNEMDVSTTYQVISGVANSLNNESTMSNSLAIESKENKINPQNSSKSFLSQIDDDNFDEPADKMDLFKAIFLDTDDEDVENVDKNVGSNTAEIEQSVKNDIDSFKSMNVLRNTSPPRGIFANLDLDKLSNKRVDNNRSKEKENLANASPPANIFENNKSSDVPVAHNEVPDETGDILENSYGPSLPSVGIEKPKSYVKLDLDVVDDRWIEKSASKKSCEKSNEKSSSKRSKEKHHHKHHKKKHKKEKKREKHKKKKKKKSSSSSESSD